LVVVAGLLAVAGLPSGSAAAASFAVNSTADTVDAAPGDGVCGDTAGTCTLRAAIMESNALGGGGQTITLPAGTYTLTVPGTGEDAAATGDLDITTREGVVRSMPKPDGRRVDKTLFSLLPGERRRCLQLCVSF
jgi:CSLREA domain-containing protein